MLQFTTIDPKNTKKILFNSKDEDELVDRVHEWAIANKVKSFSSKDECEYIVKSNMVSVDQNKFKSTSKSKISISSMVAAATEAFKIVAGKTAEQGEVERRAKICASCPMKAKAPSGACSHCGTASAAVSAATEAASKFFGVPVKTPKALSGMFCGHCDCSLDILLNMKNIEAKTAVEKDTDERPARCWMKQ